MPARPTPARHYPRLDPADARRLADWYTANARALPWREPGTSAWGVLVSEVMSQQTPVSRVIPAWQEWMDRWPTPTDFAVASPADVLRAWGNLGYPRRALRLRDCASQIVERFHGTIPADVDALETLPGIGSYTARAVACFHFGQNVPVVDTNVRRVYRRLVEGSFLPEPARARDLTKLTELLESVNETQAPTISVALMELGALICTAKNPQCGECPVADSCAWRAAGSPPPSEAEAAGARRRVQKFAGTDRQVRGKIMAVLRAADAPVPPSDIDAVWPDDTQRLRCLESLISDGLAYRDTAGTLRLPQ